MRSRSRIRCLVALLAFMLSSCESSPTKPSPDGPLQLDAQITKPRVAAGDTATITFTLRNVSSRTITLGFGSSCQILPYVTDRRTHQIVHPGGGGWVCLTVVTSLTLAPGGMSSSEVQVQAADASTYPFVALPPGDYDTYAQLDASLDGTALSLRSASVQFSVE